MSHNLEDDLLEVLVLADLLLKVELEGAFVGFPAVAEVSFEFSLFLPFLGELVSEQHFFSLKRRYFCFEPVDVGGPLVTAAIDLAAFILLKLLLKLNVLNVGLLEPALNFLILLSHPGHSGADALDLLSELPALLYLLLQRLLLFEQHALAPLQFHIIVLDLLQPLMHRNTVVL